MTRSLFCCLLVVITLFAACLAPPARGQQPELPYDISVPEGYEVQLAAGAPLVQHPMFATFDDRGRLFVCENAGVNLSAQELEAELPNSIRLLVDQDGDGRFDTSTVFADKMTFPMGGAWHDGALYVASPPYIWRLEDTDDDGVADRRDVLVSKFGYTGNAADIHGCIPGPDGRLYWCDGYHGHEFKDEEGNVLSKREGSYIFSCLPDGSDVRRHCGGGMDNPVEVDFTDEGEMLGTVNILYTRPRVDCLVHWLYGGVYPHRERVLSEVKTTGDFLGPVHRFGHVAISGTLRYRSGALDPAWRNSFFATFFNSGKVVRVELEREGATFRAVQREFLACANRDFHPTDVAEDADGSLLVVDTGGWFYRGCPTSQFAKPDVQGAIYRVRRKGAQTAADPRGLQIDWQNLSAEQLVELLGDPRHAVRRRAVNLCAQRGEPVIDALQQALRSGETVQRQNAVWALVSLGSQGVAAGPAALSAAVRDQEFPVQLAAIRGLSTYPVANTRSDLEEVLHDGHPAVRREAATALGRLGDPRSVPALLQALDTPDLERTIDHAVIFAMIEINDPAAVRAGLAAGAANVRRGALIALDQMEAGNLAAEDVIALVDTEDAQLQYAASQVFSRHAEWAPRAADMLSSLLASDASVQRSATALRRLAPRFLSEPAVGELIGQRLNDPQLSMAARDVLLEIMATGQGVPLHATWVVPLEKLLHSEDRATLERTLAVLAALQPGGFQARLEELAADAQQPILLRVTALELAAGRRGGLGDAAFDLLLKAVQDGATGDSFDAAQRLGSSALTKPQLLRLAPALTEAAPAQLAELVRPFERTTDREVAEAIIKAMENARGLTSLPPHQFSDVILSWPAELLEAGNQLLDRIRAEQQQKLARLDRLLPLIGHGDATRGREVFFSEKAKCATCHRVGEQGTRIGPDLTTIGANRTGRDLLESIVLPSATLVRDYEPYALVTADGRVLTGLIARETSEMIYLQQQTGEPVAVPREDVEQLTPSPVSIMPNGLDEALTEDELADVIAFLLQLK